MDFNKDVSWGVLGVDQTDKLYDDIIWGRIGMNSEHLQALRIAGRAYLGHADAVDAAVNRVVEHQILFEKMNSNDELDLDGADPAV